METADTCFCEKVSLIGHFLFWRFRRGHFVPHSHSQEVRSNIQEVCSIMQEVHSFVQEVSNIMQEGSRII